MRQHYERHFAKVVVAADGVSSRMALALGLERRDDRPMGVAVRTYYKSPRTHDDYLESWLELKDDNKLYKKDWIHLIPSILYLINTSRYLFNSFIIILSH